MRQVRSEDVNECGKRAYNQFFCGIVKLRAEIQSAPLKVVKRLVLSSLLAAWGGRVGIEAWMLCIGRCFGWAVGVGGCAGFAVS